MKNEKSCILTVNSGSSSLKFCVYEVHESLQVIVRGKFEKIGRKESTFSTNIPGRQPEQVTVRHMQDAADFLIRFLKSQIDPEELRGAGHRIVHGMAHQHPTLIDEVLLKDLKSVAESDPDHMPGALTLIEKIGAAFPNLRQVACFDTAFHATLPAVAKTLPIPRSFAEQGIRRYGFHGLSYSYVLGKLKEVAGNELAGGRLVLAHLGSGASMTAVRYFKSVDTTMGFTPTGGLMMGTRTGDLDPGVMLYLMQNAHLNVEKINELINKKSGLLGISETSPDMQELIKNEKTDARAAEAVDLFCYQAKKTLCAYAGALGGLDALVFTGGIGEHVSEVRSRICAGLNFLNIDLDKDKNFKNEMQISAGNQLPVFVIPTDEEYMIAKYTLEILHHHN